jgi:hypothetical protein
MLLILVPLAKPERHSQEKGIVEMLDGLSVDDASKVALWRQRSIDVALVFRVLIEGSWQLLSSRKACSARNYSTSPLATLHGGCSVDCFLRHRSIGSNNDHQHFGERPVRFDDLEGAASVQYTRPRKCFRRFSAEQG